MFLLAALLAAVTLPAMAQSNEAPFPVTLGKELAARASNSTEVSLDRRMLDFAARFMDNKDDAEGKRIISKLNGVYVRSYEFDKPGQYTPADLDIIRRQFETPDWTMLVKQRSKGATDDADIYMKLVNGEVQGMFILSAEPKELDFVYISGPIRPEDLKDLSGNFGIPSDAYKLGDKARDKAQKEVTKKAQKDGGAEAQQP
jgi:hypothetical protein